MEDREKRVLINAAKVIAKNRFKGRMYQLSRTSIYACFKRGSGLLECLLWSGVVRWCYVYTKMVNVYYYVGDAQLTF